MELIDRIRDRIPESIEDDDFFKEYIQTISDRLCLRLGTEELPKPFESVCVDAVVKMYRRTYYEGISSEGVANISTSFVEDILDEYAEEIARYRDQQANGAGGSGKVVTFR